MTQHLCGRLDEITDGVIEGWAIDGEDEQECDRLEIVVDGVVIGHTKAGLYREDLAEVGIRGGYAKFVFRIPHRFFDGKAHTVDVRHAANHGSLGNSPTSFTFEAQGAGRLSEKRDWALQTLVMQDGTRGERFSGMVRDVKRLALVSTFHNAGSFMLYHHALFRALTDAGFVVVVVHASGDVNAELDTDLGPSCYTIVKRNVGYDFGSWAVGSFVVDALMDEVEEVLLLNDSFIELEAGALAGLIERARRTGADLVGITDSYERRYHLQSYCLWFGERICRSSMLRTFLASYSFSSDKETVIEEGELTLTQRVMDAGFTATSLHPYEEVAGLWLAGLDRLVAEVRALPNLPGREGGGSYKLGLFERLDRIVELMVAGKPMNPGHFFWDTLIEDLGCKLLKRELAFVNPCQVPTHFRLGQLLAALPDAKAPLIDLRRRYGGELIPVLRGPDAEPGVQSGLARGKDRRAPGSVMRRVDIERGPTLGSIATLSSAPLVVRGPRLRAQAVAKVGGG